jgi:small subunit ribosomal protein S6
VDFSIIFRINQGKIKMNCYEHTFIAKQDLSSSQTEALISKYQDIINKNSGKVLKTQDWGIRNLAREIKKNKKGYYFHIKFDGIGKTVDELEKAENIDQSLITYLTVRVKKQELEKNYFEKVSNYEKK